MLGDANCLSPGAGMSGEGEATCKGVGCLVGWILAFAVLGLAPTCGVGSASGSDSSFRAKGVCFCMSESAAGECDAGFCSGTCRPAASESAP